MTSKTSVPTESTWPQTAESKIVAGVEEVDRRRGEQADGRRPIGRLRPDRSAQEAPAEDEEEPGDADIGEDPRDLHQPTGDV